MVFKQDQASGKCPAASVCDSAAMAAASFLLGKQSDSSSRLLFDLVALNAYLGSLAFDLVWNWILRSVGDTRLCDCRRASDGTEKLQACGTNLKLRLTTQVTCTKMRAQTTTSISIPKASWSSSKIKQVASAQQRPSATLQQWQPHPSCSESRATPALDCCSTWLLLMRT